ncbi:MAG: HNH endonuclease [Fimbriiglobus sp.]|jgi:5-methylcytosine-specific restriction endonuclease McrA|nr:HNH endonuclease [Fimbriiglobus sp.]
MPREHVPAEVVRRVWATAGHRCGYCLAPQHLVFASLEIEHVIPLAAGGTNDESNLWLACPICNGHKSSKTTCTDPVTQEVHPLFHPRTQNWHEHFAWSEDGVRIVGRTPIGRATVAALQLDTEPIALEVRSFWVSAGWHPPAPPPPAA